MPKGPGAPLRQRKQPLTDEYVLASVAGGMDPEGHYRELIYGGIEDAGRALEIKRSLYRCAKYLGYSMIADIELTADDKYQVRFHAIDKARARRHIAAKYPGGKGLPYNPYEKVNKG